jgi:hypothetical protein
MSDEDSEVISVARMAGRQKISRLGAEIFPSIGPRMNTVRDVSSSRFLC